MSKMFLNFGLGLLAGVALLPASALALEGLTGSAAITALGGNLSTVAAQYGRTTNQLVELLNRDPEVHLAANNKLVYICTHTPPATNNAGSAGKPAPQQLFPLSQTFLLHSKPGSTKTIYLDFDGMTISGTAWNADFNGGADIVAPPWDIDGSPATFSAAEQAIIQEVWFRVAEDYAPFDVDVTTEYPGEAAMNRANSGDQIFGTRALISPIASQIVQAGGVAYLGAFNEVGDYYKPALVFPENLGNDPKNIGEAASHEVGHNLNLTHQGTSTQAYFLGKGDWAPIMGAGYYVSVSQWAKGEYQDANNQEDELAFITSSGLNYRVSSFGTNFASATPFVGINNVTNGIISRTDMTNFFSFQTGTGNAGITVSNWEVGSDLHLIVGVYDSNGGLIANLETADSMTLGTLGVSATLPVINGKYYVSVAGKGYLDPYTDGYSSYASLGHYSLVITNPLGSGTFISAPKPPWGTNLAVMKGTNPNGDWLLFIQDDKPFDVGNIANGWSLSIVSANSVGYASDNALYTTPTNAPLPVAPGTPWNVTVAITNYGPSISSNVYVTDILPAGLTFNSSSASAGSYTNNGSALVWSIGTLPVNAGAVLNLNFTASSLGLFTNLATVASGTSDPNPDDDVVIATLAVANPTQQPVLSASLLPGGGGFQLSITGDGLLTTIQSSTNLVNWVDLYSGLPPFTFTDTATTNYPSKFYRAIVGQ